MGNQESQPSKPEASKQPPPKPEPPKIEVVRNDQVKVEKRSK